MYGDKTTAITFQSPRRWGLISESIMFLTIRVNSQRFQSPRRWGLISERISIKNQRTIDQMFQSPRRWGLISEDPIVFGEQHTFVRFNPLGGGD